MAHLTLEHGSPSRPANGQRVYAFREMRQRRRHTSGNAHKQTALRATSAPSFTAYLRQQKAAVDKMVRSLVVQIGQRRAERWRWLQGASSKEQRVQRQERLKRFI